MALDGDDLASVVRRSGQPAWIAYDHAPGAIAALARQVGVRCGVGAPILVDDEIWGVMAAGWADPLEPSSEAVERIGDFAELVATAIANTESRAALIASARASWRPRTRRGDGSSVIFMTACSSSW